MQTNFTSPVIDALGAYNTAPSLLVIGLSLGGVLLIRVRQRRHGSDAGKGMV